MWTFILRTATVFFIAGIITASDAAVYAPRQQLPAATIEAFKANPSQLLTETNGARLTSRVRDLGASDPSTLPFLVGLLKSSDQATQMPAIAAGLAQLAKMAARTDQAFANEIQTAVAQSGDPAAVLAYQAATGDVAIAATGGGAGGAGTGGGGPTTQTTTATGGSTGVPAFFGALHFTTLTTPSTGGSVTGATSAPSPF